jgi:hypothetical protein
LKNDVNVPSKRKKHKNFLDEKFYFFVGVLKVTVEKSKIIYPDPEPDPVGKGTDPKMPRIRNTDNK